MTQPDARIRDYLDGFDVTPGEMHGAIHAVLNLHSRQGIYDECGHTHDSSDKSAKFVDEIGYVCDDGLIRWVCAACCMDGGEYQTEACTFGHQLCWPCPTVKIIAHTIGVEATR